MSKNVVIIPARLNSSRFPQKILEPINGKPLIIHTLENAVKADVGECYIACCCESVKNIVESYNGNAIVTDPDLPSGTDRVFAALNSLNFEPDIIFNLQGDTPVFEPKILLSLLETMLSTPDIEMATPVVKIKNSIDIENPNVVKVAFNNMENDKPGQAIYFSRSPIPYNAHTFYAHLGIYAYRYKSLKKFISFNKSYLEQSEKLEQLRCLQNNMNIAAVPVEGYALCVDVKEDLQKIYDFFTNQKK